MSAGETGDGYGEFRKGWPVVLSSMLGIALGLSPLPFYTIGVFAPHLTKAFGWHQGQIMGGLTVTTLMVVWAGPAVGWLATRWPVRTKAVNHRFDRRKGLALGISLMGTGLFGFFSKGYCAWLIARFGWRGGFVGVGLLPLVIALPVALALFHDTGPIPDGTGAPALRDGGMTVGEVLRDRRFWTMASGFLIVAFALAGPAPNLEKILTLAGLPPATIVGLTSLIGLSALTGRLIGGWLIDRLWAPGVAFVILSAPALSCWLLAGAVLTPTVAACAISLIGFALGVEYDLLAFFIARYFGMRSYTAIYGILYVFFSLGAGFGPLVFGLDFDRHGNFHLSLLAAVMVLLITGALFLTLGKYRTFAPQPASDAAV